MVETKWKRGMRCAGYHRVCALYDHMLGHEREEAAFADFIRREFNTLHPIRTIGNVMNKVTMSVDLMFLVHDEDVDKISREHRKASILGVAMYEGEEALRCFYPKRFADAYSA
jgi:hypothetical protein